MIFETLRKRPNELCECDWSNLHIKFNFVGCDTQSVKKSYIITYSCKKSKLKTNKYLTFKFKNVIMVQMFVYRWEK